MTEEAEDSESPLYTQLSLSCLLDGLVNQPHFFLAQSSLHVTVHDAVTMAHLLRPIGKHTAESNQVRRESRKTQIWISYLEITKVLKCINFQCYFIMSCNLEPNGTEPIIQFFRYKECDSFMCIP